MLHTFQTQDRDDGCKDEGDVKFDELYDLCAGPISRLKALHSAWEAFCTGLGVSASDTDKMIGLPLLGGVETLELIQGIVGEIAPDEDYRRQRLDYMTQIWNVQFGIG